MSKVEVNNNLFENKILKFTDVRETLNTFVTILEEGSYRFDDIDKNILKKYESILENMPENTKFIRIDLMPHPSKENEYVLNELENSFGVHFKTSVNMVNQEMFLILIGLYETLKPE
jgi:hypothetical protein